jgi:predicted negative regulator of RcsB-dependent stress response
MLIDLTDGIRGNTLFNKIARVNAARLFYAEEKYDEALNLLEKYSSSSSAMIHELLGDILTKQDKIDLAKDQYLLSKDKYTDEVSTSIVSIKISNLSE